LETQIGEGNRGISGGQAQRIALARVLLDKAREVLIFDEPTAHLDIETEYELKKTLLPIMENHLVILATHRLHWLGNMDQVLVLDQGEVVESGAPADLIGAGGALDGLISEMGGNQIDRYLD
jgi:ATP-binding cassette, subfamily C, bacterial CydD